MGVLRLEICTRGSSGIRARRMLRHRSIAPHSRDFVYFRTTSEPKAWPSLTATFWRSRAARNPDPEIQEVRAVFSSAALSERGAAKPCVRPVHGVFIPSSISATVVFGDSLNPAESLRTIHDEARQPADSPCRGLIESLAAKMSATSRPAARSKNSARICRSRKGALHLAHVAIPKNSPAVRLEILGVYSGGAALRTETEEFLEPAGLTP